MGEYKRTCVFSKLEIHAYDKHKIVERDDIVQYGQLMGRGEAWVGDGGVRAG